MHNSSLSRWALLGHAVNLTFDLLTPNINVFILVPKWMKAKSLVKFSSVIFKISQQEAKNCISQHVGPHHDLELSALVHFGTRMNTSSLGSKDQRGHVLDFWSIPARLFPDSCQIPWHFQVFQKWLPCIRCLSLIFPNFITPALLRSSSLQSIHLFDGLPPELLPLLPKLIRGYHTAVFISAHTSSLNVW